METVLHLPLDHESWIEYRDLKASVGGPLATFAVVRLFVDLAYQAQAGRPLGTLDERAQKLFTSNLDLTQMLPRLQAAGFLVAGHGHPGNDLYCERFVRLNPQLDPNWKPVHIRGSERSAIVRNERKYQKECLQFALMIPAEVWEKPGTSGSSGRMTHQEIEDVMMLIRGCDNALRRPERPQNEIGFPKSLVEAAYLVLTEFRADQINVILRKIFASQGHSAIPPTTEQLLAPGGNDRKSRFAELATLIK